MITIIITHLDDVLFQRNCPVSLSTFDKKKSPSSDLSEEGLLIPNYLFLTLYFRVWIDLPGHY